LTTAATVVILLSPLPAKRADAAEIDVAGNSWTSTGYLEDLGHRCLGESGGGSEVMEQCLMDSQLFSEVFVKPEGGGVAVTVKERWPILPIPYFRSEGDSVMYGVFLTHANFLGRGKKAVLGGLWGNDVTNYYLSYRDPSIALTDWTGKLDLRRRKEDLREYSRGVAIYGYTRDETSVSAGLGYRITPRLELQGGLWYRDRSYAPLDPFVVDLEAYASLSAGFELTWDVSHFRLYYQEGTKLFVRARREVARSDGERMRSNIRVTVDHQTAVPWGTILKLGVQGLAMDSDDPRDAFMDGGKPGIRGAQPQGLWFRTLGAAGIDWQFPLRRTAYGTVTAGPFLDGAVFQGVRGEGWDTTWSWGIGAYLYLKTIALPGVGITVGRNDRFADGTFVSFQLGYEF
jgi:hypothetical protein